MGTELDIQTALAAANTTHISMGQEIFSNPLPGPYQLWTTRVDDSSGKVQNNILANLPIMQTWVGARKEKQPRAYTFSITAVPYEATLYLKRTTISRDKTGTVAKAIGDFHRDNAPAYDRAVAAALDGSSGNGPTGYDAVALFNSAHPHVNSLSGHSNVSASTDLSHANFNTARTNMRAFKTEAGEPFGILPTHMRVGPSLEQRAKEILEAKTRVVYSDMTAAETTAAVQNTTAMDNVWQGELQLVVDPRVTTYYCDLFDLSKSVKPMILLVERPIEAVSQTDMEGDRRFNDDEFVFGLEGDHVATAGFWQTAYRLQGTA